MLCNVNFAVPTSAFCNLTIANITKITTAFSVYQKYCNFVLFLCCRPYKCKICAARFSQPSVLAYHMDSHKGPSFSCHICGRAFNQNYSLKKHVNTHLRIRRFPCDYCSQTYLTAEGLRNHIGRHTGERSYKCGLCPMTFNCTAKSSIHRRKHLIDGSYQCEKCPFHVKGFAGFKTHLLACHPERLIL